MVQATSCEVAKAHCVAEEITLSCWIGSSAVLATVFAFSTRDAVAFATALARASKASCKINRFLINKMLFIC